MLLSLFYNRQVRCFGGRHEVPVIYLVPKKAVHHIRETRYLGAAMQ